MTTKKRVVGRDAYEALKERRKKAEGSSELVVLEIGGEELRLKPFVPAAVLIEMMHFGLNNDLHVALDSLSKAFVKEDGEKLLQLLSSDSDEPVDIEYVTDLIGIVSEELTGRPLENENAS